MKKLLLSPHLMSVILSTLVLIATSKVMAQTYPFTLPETVTASFDVTTSIKEVANNKLLGANIGGFTSTDEKALMRKFDPVTVRFPSGVWINWYDWTVDGNRIYDDYVSKTYLGVPDSTYIKMINGSQNSRTGFPGLTALNTERKLATGKGYDMLWGYNMNYDDNAKSAARLRDSEAKGFEVNYIEMGNEIFYGNQRSNRTSTPQKYVAVAKSLADTLRKIKPGIKLSVPLAWRTPQSYIDYNKALTADTTYFDAVTVHKYVGSDPDEPATFTYKDVLAGRLMLEKDVNYARKLANTKPVWLTEWGVAAGSECQAAAALGMADCYLFLYENQKIYGRADWYCINGLLNSFITFVGSSRTIKLPLEKTGYGSVHQILRSVFENATLLKGAMTTTKLSTSNGSTDAISARTVIKNGDTLVVAVNLTNKPVSFELKFDGVVYTKLFKHEALAFDNLSQDKIMGIDVNPLQLIKSGRGVIMLPPLSVNKISLDESLESYVNFESPANASKIDVGSNLLVKANAGAEITNVSLFINNQLVRNITTAPFVWGSDPLIDPLLANLQIGKYDLKLIGINGSLKTTESIISIEVMDTTVGAQSPFAGVIQIPGAFEAENYDIGGEGISYHDTSEGNTYNNYRTDGVDIGSIATTGGFCIGGTEGGEWIEYSVNVAETGYYDIDFLYSSGSPTLATIGASFEDIGQSLFNGFTLAKTTNWSTYVTLTKPAVLMPAGNHVLRITVEQRALNFDRIEFRRSPNAVNNLNENNRIVVYPNPSNSGIFKLKEPTKWEVYNSLGQKMLSENGSIINLTSFSKGSYILKIDNRTSKLLYY